ncbi:MAG TPA: Trk family potassium uptake protein [Ruminococcaceae bacterium]|nr:Trk family potassium uptake protein [Oscillospiraceae bacterium]
MKNKLTHFNTTRLIVLFFLSTILIGTFLLCLPFSAKSREWTPFLSSLFTATSATCVTGLSVFDTYTHWSLFGQIVIILLIQCGGLGIMTTITMFSIFTKRRISLYERKLLMQSEGTMRTGGVFKLLKRIVAGTFCIEGIGSVLLAVRFCPKFGLPRGLYYAVFHSISSFCNAGFDLMGRLSPGSSLTLFADDVIVNLTVCALIVIGGIGFLVWDDLLEKKQHFKKYTLQTKIVLSFSAFLIVFGSVFFFLFEENASMQGMSTPQRLLASLFQSVSARTAGFYTVDMSKLSVSGNLLMTALMFIGASPGSTAGGVKTTTVAVLLLQLFASARGNKNPTVFKRCIDDETVKRAASIAVIYVLLDLFGTMFIAAVDRFSLPAVLFETVSAAGTVGLSTGITAQFSSVSQFILVLLMFCGRIGGLTMMVTLAEKKKNIPLHRPGEKILIG